MPIQLSPEAAGAASGDTQNIPGTLEGAEEEVWAGRPDIRTVAARFFVAGLSFIVIILAAALLLPHAGSLQRNVLHFASALIAVVGVWLLVSIARVKLTLRYRLTSHRLFIERGFLSKRSEELDLRRIEDASVRQSLFDRLTNVGDIILTSSEASDPLYVIVGVAQPFELRETLRRRLRGLGRATDR